MRVTRHSTTQVPNYNAVSIVAKRKKEQNKKRAKVKLNMLHRDRGEGILSFTRNTNDLQHSRAPPEWEAKKSLIK